MAVAAKPRGILCPHCQSPTGVDFTRGLAGSKARRQRRCTNRVCAGTVPTVELTWDEYSRLLRRGSTG